MLLGIYDDLLMHSAGSAAGPGPGPIIGARKPRLFVGGLPNDYTTGGPVIFTEDGQSYTETALPDGFFNFSGCFAFGNDVTVCLAGHFAGSRVKSFISKDYGATWNEGGWVTADAYYARPPTSMVFANGLFVTCANHYSTGQIFTSPDGINWTLRDMGFAGMANRVWYVNGRFFVTGYQTNGRTMAWATSADGISWARMPDVFPPVTGTMGAITYLNGKWILGGVVQGGYYAGIAFSTDLSNWTIVQLPWPIATNPTAQINEVVNIVYFKGKYYAGGNGSSAPLVGFSSSSDLVNWTNVSPGFTTGPVRSLSVINDRMIVTGEPFNPNSIVLNHLGDPPPPLAYTPRVTGTYTRGSDGTMYAVYPPDIPVGIMTSTSDGNSFSLVPLTSKPFWTFAGFTL